MPPPPAPLVPAVTPRGVALPGRDGLRAELLAGVAAAVGGRGRATTLVAEPGVGKTTLLDAFVADVRRVHPDVVVVRVSGVEAEYELGWAGLHALVRPLGHVRAGLSGPRARALAAALAEREPGPGEVVEPFAVALATYDLVVAAAEAAPVVVVVDDVHWLDHASRRTLAFVARRIGLDRVALVAARRPGDRDGDQELDLGTLQPVPALDAEAAREVVAAAGVSDPEVRERILAAGAGNPLVLTGIVGLLDADQRAGRRPLPDPLPVGLSARRVTAGVLSRLAPADRPAVLVAATEGRGDLAAVVRALRHMGLDPAGLDAAERAGVVSINATQVTFRHPLLRSAVYHDALDAERRAAHAALAATLPASSAARASHRALATVGHDDGVAAELDAAARASARGAAHAVAGQLWELASRLSERDDERAVWLRRAATAFLDAGEAPRAGALLDRAERLHRSDADASADAEHYERLRIRVRLPLDEACGRDPLRQLIEGADALAARRPALAADLVTDAAAVAVRDVAWDSLLQLTALAEALRDRVDPDRADRLDVLAGLVGAALGDPTADGRLDRWRRLAEPERASAHAAFLAGVVAPALAFLRRVAAADELLDQLEPPLRARGASADLEILLTARAMGQYGRSLPATLQATTEVLALAAAAGPVVALYPASLQATAAAAVGDATVLDQAVAALRRQPGRRREAAALVARGFAALVERRLDEADAIYTRLESLAPIGTWVARWEPEWVESLVRAGRRDAAADLLERIDLAMGEAGADPAGVLGLERVRGMLADEEDVAYEHFARSLELAETAHNAIALGRTETAWGERLRRARRRSEARRHLDRARTVLRGVGATALAALAEGELVAAGGAAADDVAPHERLTPHEVRVARLAVGGSSNRQLADQLFVSPRTVEAHLSTIFRKLGVANRRELAALALHHSFLRP